jgi:exoribonuclease-2
MNVLFEEDGAFKAGAVLADNTTSLQVELASGKRSQGEGGQRGCCASLRRRRPNCSTAPKRDVGPDIERRISSGRVCPKRGIRLRGTLAARVLRPPADGRRGRRACCCACIRHRSTSTARARARFRKAPPEILQAALAGLERKSASRPLAIERMAR